MVKNMSKENEADETEQTSNENEKLEESKDASTETPKKAFIGPLDHLKEELIDAQETEEEEIPKKASKKTKNKKEKSRDILKEEPKEISGEGDGKTHIFALRTTANREDQVMDFLVSNVVKKKLNVYTVIRPHGMRGYIFVEAEKRIDAEQAGFNIPYARGILRNEIEYKEIEHMLEQVKKELDIRKNDIAEIISGPFKREKCKITRIDKTKDEVVVELLEAAVPIPITLKIDALKVIRRENEDALPKSNRSDDDSQDEQN